VSEAIVRGASYDLSLIIAVRLRVYDEKVTITGFAELLRIQDEWPGRQSAIPADLLVA